MDALAVLTILENIANTYGIVQALETLDLEYPEYEDAIFAILFEGYVMSRR